MPPSGERGAVPAPSPLLCWPSGHAGHRPRSRGSDSPPDDEQPSPLPVPSSAMSTGGPASDYSDRMTARNHPVLSRLEQDVIGRASLAFVGCGLSSQIALGAARLGFRRFLLWDGDVVDDSNLNRQAFFFRDIGANKAEATARLIRSVNPEADCHACGVHIDGRSAGEPAAAADIVVNTADFGLTAYQVDSRTREQGKPCLHPLNLGFGGFCMVTTPTSVGLEDMTEGTQESPTLFLLNLRRNVSGLRLSRQFERLSEDILAGAELGLPFPQNTVATSVTAAIAVSLLLRLAVGRPVPVAPVVCHLDVEALFESLDALP